ncbi:hypothetical protein [Halomicrobium urmianum]|uniref:hypothetical protein n=1 Tax=Halomicrobium urmianum TaxID=1586233 RepID=UPI001CD9CDE6|nr:hypothetical protein [Halomicrobium urmianum]
MSELSDYRLKQLSLLLGVGSAFVVVFVAFAFLESRTVRLAAIGVAVVGAVVQPVVLYRVFRAERESTGT